MFFTSELTQLCLPSEEVCIPSVESMDVPTCLLVSEPLSGSTFSCTCCPLTNEVTFMVELRALFSHWPTVSTFRNMCHHTHGPSHSTICMDIISPFFLYILGEDCTKVAQFWVVFIWFHGLMFCCRWWATSCCCARCVWSPSLLLLKPTPRGKEKRKVQ